ncbi:hypothetical protein GCM10009654_38780 [Streptomyces hebeiensis]|uniref:Uncharacterized protein n=1 Tax=Streptomyces hebeiensis TaxID=229486 RepID=A0ABN1UX44_9ACTN
MGVKGYKKGASGPLPDRHLKAPGRAEDAPDTDRTRAGGKPWHGRGRPGNRTPAEGGDDPWP